MITHENNLKHLRLLLINNEPWFLAEDITKYVGTTNATLDPSVLITLTKEEMRQYNTGEENYPKRNAKFISSSGVLDFLSTYSTPEAAELEEHLTSTVLSMYDKQSNNKLSIFTSSEFGEIRTASINNEPYFVGKDICTILGDTNHKRSLARIDSCDKAMASVDTPGGKQNMTVVNESGLYALLFQMQPKKAKGVLQNSLLVEERVKKIQRFKHWVTSEVLPQIRKTGGYIPVTQEDDEKTILAKALQIMNNTLGVKDALIQKQKIQIDEMKPKAEFTDHLATTTETISVKDMADLLSDYGFRFTQNSLFSFLREQKILSSSSANWNKPYKKYIDAEYFKVKETLLWKTGLPVPYLKTVITGSGQHFIYKLAMNNRKENTWIQ